MGGREQDGAKPRDSWVSVDLVSLADSTASYKSLDKGGQTRPPVVPLNQVNSAEITAMSSPESSIGTIPDPVKLVLEHRDGSCSKEHCPGTSNPCRLHRERERYA